MKEAETMKKLGIEFHQVEIPGGTNYGGNQAWFPYEFLRNAGCGVISGTDLLLHLKGRSQITKLEYMDFAKKLWQKYLPVIPFFGMNGLTLMVGLNRYFKQENMPYHACWMISGKKMLSRMENMLKEDIPVILSIGPNFPFFWRKEKLNLYKRTNTGEYCLAAKVKAHYVTVTGMDEEWMQISSWGKEYGISIREYEKYVRENSSSLVSNIIYVKKYKKSDNRRFL